MLFSHALRDKKPWKFVLQDYNDIFRLVTVPNLFLTWYVNEHENADEITVTSELKEQFLTTLHTLGIEIQLIIGAWGPQLTVLSPCWINWWELFVNVRFGVILRGNILTSISSTIYVCSCVMRAGKCARSVEEGLFWSWWWSYGISRRTSKA